MTSRIVGRHPNGSCASRRVIESRSRPCSPQRRHRSSRSTTQQANTALSGSRNWPVTRNPSPSSRAKVVRSGVEKLASAMSRSIQMDSVRTSIIGRPRPLSRQRRADPDYTLICEEPLNAAIGPGGQMKRQNLVVGHRPIDPQPGSRNWCQKHLTLTRRSTAGAFGCHCRRCSDVRAQACSRVSSLNLQHRAGCSDDDSW